jgi:hypothetical protein
VINMVLGLDRLAWPKAFSFGLRQTAKQPGAATGFRGSALTRPPP